MERSTPRPLPHAIHYERLLPANYDRDLHFLRLSSREGQGSDQLCAYTMGCGPSTEHYTGMLHGVEV